MNQNPPLSDILAASPVLPGGRVRMVAVGGLAAFLTILPATAAVVTLNAPVNVTTNYTLTGSTVNRTVAFPRFDPSLGTLTSITVGYSNAYIIDALSEAETGVFIPPDWIASWSWNVLVAFDWSGAGFDLPLGEQLSASRSITSDEFPLTAHVRTPQRTLTSSLVTLLPGDPGFSSYLGTGNILTQFSTAHSTTVYPLPATVAGFTWLPTNNVTAGGIAQASASQLFIQYSYTAAPVPEISGSIFALSALGLLPLRRRR